MNLINIYEPKAVIVIEKFADNSIKQSSNLFCGACGRIVAIVKENLEFDFRFNDLKKVSNSFFLFVVVKSSLLKRKAFANAAKSPLQRFFNNSERTGAKRI